ncbi:MAG: hypothetical protein OEZ04_10525 [Nitrospinota bacterium]|nr:hypothetical protein [Nitrospinota bacterium]
MTKKKRKRNINSGSSKTRPIAPKPAGSSSSDKPFEETGKYPRQEYLDHRALLIEIRLKAEEYRGKLTVSLAGGALGISMVFTDKLATDPIVNSEYLFNAWGLWALSLTFILLSYFPAIANQDEQLVWWKKFQSNTNAKPPGNFYDFCYKFLTFLAGTAFIAGVVFIILFVSCNMPNQSKGGEYYGF